MQNDDLPMNDPTPHLSPTATRLLEAAKRVLARDGFRGLTFESISRESGENQALIRYHFGNKAGLISTLIDSVMYLEAVEFIDALSAAPAGAERGLALLQLHRKVARELEAYRMYYELVPELVRDDELREHFRRLLEWYRKLDAWALAPSADSDWASKLEPLALLTVALADGIALQVQADPDLDIDAACDLHEMLVSGYLKSLGASRIPERDSDRASFAR